jgi:hypothetical protein
MLFMCVRARCTCTSHRQVNRAHTHTYKKVYLTSNQEVCENKINNNNNNNHSSSNSNRHLIRNNYNFSNFTLKKKLMKTEKKDHHSSVGLTQKILPGCPSHHDYS